MHIPLFIFVFTYYMHSVQSACSDDSSEWSADPEDCKVFYLCLGGTKLKYVCPDNTVANIENRVCVQRGSSLDQCTNKEIKVQSTLKQDRQTVETTTNSPSTTTKMLNVVCMKPGLNPVSNNCARFLQCTTTLTATLQECPYPKLFDTGSHSCQMPGLVQCGTRYEPLDPCEYSENDCTKTHCIPCNIRFPSCRGLSDGLNPWTGREWSPYFAICRFERVVFQGKCTYEEHSDEQIFDPKLRVCVKALS